MKTQSSSILRSLNTTPPEEWRDVGGFDEILDENGSLVTQLREVLWMKTEYENLEWKDKFLAIGAYLYKQEILTEVEFYSVFKHLISIGEMEDENALDVVVYFNEFKSFEEFMKKTFEQLYTLAYPIPSPAKLVAYYEEIFGEVEDKDHWLQIDGRVSGMEFWEETSDLKDLSAKEIREMFYWAQPDLRSKLVDELLSRETEDAAPTSWAELDKFAESNEFLAAFPTSFKVYGSKLSQIPPRSVDVESLAKYPPEIVQERALGFAYSRPESEEWFKIYFPGGERIGHAGIFVKTGSGSFLLDFGMTVINNRMPRWKPFLERVDAVLLSHAHLDHSGALPYLLRSSGPLAKTPWFGTRHTRIMTEMLFRDTRNVLGRNWESSAIENNPYIKAVTSEQNITNALSNHIEIDLDEEFSPLPNVTVRAFGASHLFGSVGFDIQIGGKRLFYTGDFNLQGGTLFPGAKFPVDTVDTLLFDGTNFGKYNENVNTVDLKQVLRDHKRVIIPAFAMGRTQEILYKLLANDVHKDKQIIVAGMGGRLFRELKLSIKSKNVKLAPTIIKEEFRDNTILIAGNGMLQAGTSRQILDKTKDDDDVGVVFCGYQSPNTFGYHLLNGNPRLREEYKQQIYKIKLSGHSTADSLDNFLGGISGRKTIVHSPEGAFENGKRDDVIRPRDIEGEFQ